MNHSPRSPGRMRPRACSLPHASDGPQALSSMGWKLLAARGGMGWGRCSSLGSPPPFPGSLGCRCSFPGPSFGVR